MCGIDRKDAEFIGNKLTHALVRSAFYISTDMNIANCVHFLACVLKSLWCRYAVSPIGLRSFSVATSSSWHDVLLGLVEALIMYSFI